MIDAVLFDLDGTLADTAADLGGALNRLRTEQGLEAMPLEVLRPYASHGVRGLLGAGLGLKPTDEAYAGYAQRFLAYYAAALCVDTALYPGIAELIGQLEAHRLRWGVVTNKTSRFTLPLLAALGVARRAACVVSGDSAPRPKPHPAPLLMAADLVQTAPGRCIYVGDDLRDVEAGRAAGMPTVVAAYGYLGNDKPVEEWGADALISRPEEILGLLHLGAC